MSEPLTLDDVETALHAAGSNPRAGQCRCPNPDHEDHNPSATYGVGRAGDVLLKCHSRGCDFESMLAGIRDHLPNRRQAGDPQRPPTVYTYLDEHGEPAYRVVRSYGPDGDKRFHQQRYDPSRDDPWVGGPGAMKGIPRLPYRLPALIAGIKAGKMVYVTEGEKDADRLVRLGHVATCNSGGAGNFAAELTPWFARAAVTVIADCDEPGLEHARKVAALLEKAGATVTTRRPPYPITSDHGRDVSDWLNQGHDLADLVAIDDASAQPTATTTDDAPGPPRIVGLICWRDAWRRERESATWIAEPVIPGGGRSTVLYATKGVGKSDLLLWIALRLALARAPFPGGPPPDRPVRVLYLDNEMTVDDVLDRAEAFGIGPSDDLDHALAYYSLPDLRPLDTEAGASDVGSLVRYHQPELVILDTITRAVTGEENKSDSILAVGRHITQPLKRAGISFVAAGHAGKDLARGQRGTSEHGGIDELVWQMTRDDHGTVKLKGEKRRSPWMPDRVSLQRFDRDGLITWERCAELTSPPALEVALKLDRLEAPPDLSVNQAGALLRSAGHTVARAVLAEAVRHRKRSTERFPELGGNGHPERSPDPRPDQGGTVVRNTSERSSSVVGTFPHPKGGNGSDAGPGTSHNPGTLGPLDESERF